MKICILAAGKGSRNQYAAYIPKGLLPVDNKPVIWHLLKSAPNADIVIALGHHGQIYREFFQLQFQDRKVEFVEVDKIEGPGSGPGYSLLSCRSKLNEPFLLLPTDAYISEELSGFDTNWLGVSVVDSNFDKFCLVDSSDAQVTGLRDKQPAAGVTHQDAFNGIAFIKDFDAFFDGLVDAPLVAGEIQVSSGFAALIAKKKVKTCEIKSWADTGTTVAYESLLRNFPKQQLVKPRECAYLIEEEVLKYNFDVPVNELKVGRGKDLADFIPTIRAHTSHFFKYDYVEGRLLSEEKDPAVFSKLLEDLNKTLWRELSLNDRELKEFFENNETLYVQKTRHRLSELEGIIGRRDREWIINGIRVQPAAELVSRVELEVNDLNSGKPCYFHGDFQPENIVIGRDRNFLIDWRQESVQGSSVGDVYYDLAKMRHALMVAGQVVRRGAFSVEEPSFNSVEIRIEPISHLVELDKVLVRFMAQHGYDARRVNVITALIFIGIAPFYQKRYATFLWALGSLFLQMTLDAGDNNTKESRNHDGDYGHRKICESLFR